MNINTLVVNIIQHEIISERVGGAHVHWASRGVTSPLGYL